MSPMISSRCTTGELKSIHHGGDSMNRLNAMKPSRLLALVAIIFGAMVMTSPIPAYGQQEMDPTWYNPWAAPNPAAARTSAPPAAVHQYHASVRHASARSKRLQAKRIATRRTPS